MPFIRCPLFVLSASFGRVIVTSGPVVSGVTVAAAIGVSFLALSFAIAITAMLSVESVVIPRRLAFKSYSHLRFRDVSGSVGIVLRVALPATVVPIFIVTLSIPA